MAFDFQTWYLSAVPVVLAYVISVLANGRLEGTRRDLGDAVRTRHDLAAVRAAIDFNKRMAWCYLALWAGQIVAVLAAAGSGLTTFRGAVGHVFVFGVGTLPGGLWSKSVEEKFKAMAVDGADLELDTTFQRYLADWRKPSLSIPE